MTETQTETGYNRFERLTFNSNLAVNTGVAGDISKYVGLLLGIHAVLSRPVNETELLFGAGLYFLGAVFGRAGSQKVAYHEAQRALLSLDQQVTKQTEVK